MSSKNQKYMEQMQRHMRQNTLSADGRRNQRYVRADGWLQRSVAFNAAADQGRFFAADAGTVASPQNQASYSQPIVLQLSNSSATATSVNLWGAAVYLDNSTYTWTAGNLVINNVTISLISQTNPLNTYRSAQQQSIAQPMTIGKTAINVISGSNSQVSQIWGLNTFAMNANSAAQQYVNYLNPQQYQAGVIENFTKYDLDGQTYLSLPVLGSVVFQMFFFPLADINLSRPLVGQNTARSYNPPPGNLAAAPVVIQNG